MKKYTEPLFPDTFYHIYNRGINGGEIFVERDNYRFFLEKYSKYVSSIADTYAYCLLKNHFHFLIKTKTADDILNVNPGKDVQFTLSKRFATLFNSYTQAFNFSLSRTGG